MIQISDSDPYPLTWASLHVNSVPSFLENDSRVMMRHSNGDLHCAVVSAQGAKSKISVIVNSGSEGPWRTLVDEFPSENTSTSDDLPATDSNGNGIYVAFIRSAADGLCYGYVAHIPPSIEGVISDTHIHGPLTAGSKQLMSSFIQVSGEYNSVCYGWVDISAGNVYAGISRDGIRFSRAVSVAQEAVGALARSAVGIYGDYAACAYLVKSDIGWTTKFVETADAGGTWSNPTELSELSSSPAIRSRYLVSDDQDIKREILQVPFAAETAGSIQLLAWPAPASTTEEFQLKSRLFVLSTVSSVPASSRDISLVSFKPIGPSGTFDNVTPDGVDITVRGIDLPFDRQVWSKYAALPQTPVRAIASLHEGDLQSTAQRPRRLVLHVSTNTGQSFDRERTFELDPEHSLGNAVSNSACLFVDDTDSVWLDLVASIDGASDGELVHVMVPCGLQVTGLDPSKAW